ncbi:MAG: response regulator transcription factor [Opitutaceae bacterium]
MKRVVIVEDQTAVRQMLAHVLSLEGNYEIVGESGDGHEATALIRKVRPDLLILDARLPGMNGHEILQAVQDLLPRLRVLVFSGYENPVIIRDLLNHGAHGFVEKSANLEELRRGIEAVANGGTYFGPAAAVSIRNLMTGTAGSATSRDLLTDREREILKLIAESHSTKQIAARLGLSVKTADNHRTNLMRKLDLHDVAGLTRFAIQIGLVEAAQLPGVEEDPRP